MKKKVIILAAGKGTRMHGETAKVLVSVNGQPMIEYALAAVKNICKPVVIIGYQGDLVAQQLGDRAEIVWQVEQLGTGHAVSCAKEILNKFNGAILILYGDHPLVTENTIEKLFELHEKKDATISLMTTVVPNFSDWREGFNGFGRILRDKQGEILGIRELKDCTAIEKEIFEVNPGYYCFESQWLWKNIDKIQNKNNQKEYYLTDLIELAVQEKERIFSLKIDAKECLGINTEEQRAFVESILKNR
jgi:bifunctional UDP-N-acetylglucosamine pyrophosphorylase/glucosamine-1-phosphate N-acetyltransferase